MRLFGLATGYFDLTKIHTLPIIGCEWKYLFHLDEPYAYPLRYRQAVYDMAPLTSELKILGRYAVSFDRQS